MSKNLLSKSTFIRSLQCQKSLYLYKRHRELQDELSAEQKLTFSRGHRVGFLARQLFPGGVDVGWNNPRFYKKSVKLTQKLIESNQRVIYEASFLADDILVAVDILVREEDGWHMYEVKSSLKISETFLRDAALQYRVIKKAGIDLSGVHLVHLNRDYAKGTKLDLPSLFQINDVLEQVQMRQAYVLSNIVQARETLRHPSPPEISIGPHCHDPYPCDFQGHCWADVPSDSIYYLSEMEEERRKKLLDQGIRTVDEIPEEFPLTKAQKIQLDTFRHGSIHIDSAALLKFINKIRFPAVFADLDMSRPAVPLMQGTKPYQNIPFQWSLLRLAHLCAEPEQQHFLAEAGHPMYHSFVKSFLKATEDVKTIVVYDQNAELRVLNDIASAFPEWKEDIAARAKKIVDLSEVFRLKHFYHPMQKGYDLRHILSVFGKEFPKTDHSIPGHYLAGAAFEQLFFVRDFFELGNLRAMLREFSLAQCSGILEIFKAVREEALKEAEPA